MPSLKSRRGLLSAITSCVVYDLCTLILHAGAVGGDFAHSYLLEALLWSDSERGSHVVVGPRCADARDQAPLLDRDGDSYNSVGKPLQLVSVLYMYREYCMYLWREWRVGRKGNIVHE